MRARAFIPITKVDLERREVIGVAAEERTDKTGREKFDYATSKPLFEAFADDFRKRTEASGVGLSLGAIREMHQPSAVGKAIDWQFDDATKQVHVAAKIVDDAAWAKVVEGVYTGFSIGGDYATRWPDPDEKGVTRYAARPVEVSLVDNPCMYGATFECVRADGAVELRKFQRPEIPMDTTALLTRVDAAKAALAPLDPTRPLAKSLWTVGRLAELLEQFRSVLACARSDSAHDGEGAEAPALAQLQAALATMADGFAQLAAAEAAELQTGSDADDAAMSDPMLLAALGDLAKMDPAQAKAVLKRVQQLHDIAKGFGAACAMTKAADPAAAPAVPDGEDEMDGAALQKAFDAHTETLTKSVGDIVGGAITKAMEPVTAQVAALAKTVEEQGARLAKVEAQPAVTKGVATAAIVAREHDSGVVATGDPIEKLTGEAKGHAMLLRKIAAGPLPLSGGAPQIAGL